MTAVEAVFVVACSAGKIPGGSGLPFSSLSAGSYTFPSLHEIRSRMVEHYSSLTREEAGDYYRSGRSRRRVLRAWESNWGLLKKPPLKAIERYRGALYSSLNWSSELESKNRRGTLKILSAMFGPLTPQDPLPRYELMITDQTPFGSSAKVVWRDASRGSAFRREFESVFPDARYLYLLLSTPYFTAAKPLTDLLESYRILVPRGGTGISPKTWGRVVRQALMSGVTTPDDMRIVVERLDCTMRQASH